MSEAGTKRNHAAPGASGGGTFVGYALAADTVLAQAIKTDTAGIVAGDFQVKITDSYSMPVYEARPEKGKDHPIVLGDLGVRLLKSE